MHLIEELFKENTLKINSTIKPSVVVSEESVPVAAAVVVVSEESVPVAAAVVVVI